MVNGIAISAGLGISASAIFLLFWRFMEKRDRFKIRDSLNKIYITQRSEVDKWIDSLDKNLKKNEIKVKTRKILLVNSILFLGSFILALYLFKNITASFFFALTFFIIPEYMLFLYQDHRKRKIEDQMISAIRIFTVEMVQTRNIEKAFAAIANRIVDPVGRYFSNAYTDLLRGIPLDSVLIELSKKVDSEYWKLFIPLIYEVNKNSAVLSLFSDLIAKIEDHIELSRINAASLSGERIIALVMALLPIPAYFFMQSIIPETVEFVTVSPIGRLCITISFLSLFVFIILDRIIRKVD